MKSVWVVIALGLVVGSCCSDVPPTVPKKSINCVAACKHLRDLKCQEGYPTPEGNPCEMVCENVQFSGIVLLDLQCIVASENCNEASKCK